MVNEFANHFIPRMVHMCLILHTIITSCCTDWAIPENIRTYTTDGFLDFRRGGGVHDYGILRAWGGIYVWKSEDMGGFHRWDFLRRKCTVSSLKTLSLWTFIVRK